VTTPPEETHSGCLHRAADVGEESGKRRRALPRKRSAESVDDGVGAGADARGDGVREAVDAAVEDAQVVVARPTVMMGMSAVAITRPDCVRSAVHGSTRDLQLGCMASQRINITLDPEHDTMLARLAARVHVSEGTLARSLLSSAIDDADPDADTVVAVLDPIDGAWDRAQVGRRQAASGDTIRLDQL
jgi:hypothetical protein